MEGTVLRTSVLQNMQPSTKIKEKHTSISIPSLKLKLEEIMEIKKEWPLEEDQTPGIMQ